MSLDRDIDNYLNEQDRLNRRWQQWKEWAQLEMAICYLNGEDPVKTLERIKGVAWEDYDRGEPTNIELNAISMKASELALTRIRLGE